MHDFGVCINLTNTTDRYEDLGLCLNRAEFIISAITDSIHSLHPNYDILYTLPTKKRHSEVDETH